MVSVVPSRWHIGAGGGLKQEDAQRVVEALVVSMPGTWIDGIFIMRAMNQSQLDTLKNNWIQLLIRLTVEEKA